MSLTSSKVHLNSKLHNGAILTSLAAFFVYAMIPALRLVTQSIRRSRYLLIIVFQIFQMYVMSLIYIHGFKPYFIFVSLKSSPSGHHWIFHIYLSHKTARALNLTAYVFFLSFENFTL